MLEFSRRAERNIRPSWTLGRIVVLVIFAAFIAYVLFSACPARAVSEDWLYERLVKATERQAVATEKQNAILLEILKQIRDR